MKIRKEILSNNAYFRILCAIEQLHHQNGEYPNITEIGDKIERSPSTVFLQLKYLENKGFVNKIVKEKEKHNPQSYVINYYNIRKKIRDFLIKLAKKIKYTSKEDIKNVISRIMELFKTKEWTSMDTFLKLMFINSDLADSDITIKYWLENLAHKENQEIILNILSGIPMSENNLLYYFDAIDIDIYSGKETKFREKYRKETQKVIDQINLAIDNNEDLRRFSSFLTTILFVLPTIDVNLFNKLGQDYIKGKGFYE